MARIIGRGQRANGPRSASARATAASMWARCVNAWGKLPSSSRASGSTSSENRPTPLASAQGPVECRPGGVELALMSQALGQPERAAHERALLAWQSILTSVSVEQAVASVEFLAHGLGCADHPLVTPIDELHGGEEQERGVEFGTIVGLDEDAAFVVIAATLDRAAQPVSHLLPASHGSSPHAFVSQPDAAIERRPAEHLGVDEVLRSAGEFPDSPVGLGAMLGGVVDQREQKPPIVIAGRMPAAVPAPGQVDQLSVGVELALRGGVVSHPHRLAGAEPSSFSVSPLVWPATTPENLQTSAWPAAERMMKARKGAASSTHPSSANVREPATSNRAPTRNGTPNRARPRRPREARSWVLRPPPDTAVRERLQHDRRPLGRRFDRGRRDGRRATTSATTPTGLASSSGCRRSPGWLRARPRRLSARGRCRRARADLLHRRRQKDGRSAHARGPGSAPARTRPLEHRRHRARCTDGDRGG